MNGKDQADTEALYRDYLLGNYGLPPVTFLRGEGLHLWDDAGKRYLDFGAGIAVSAIGHSHPHWVRRVQEQAATLAHTSNLFRNEAQGELARALVEKAGAGRCYFCNSGAEANETLIKLARLHGRQLSNGQENIRYKVLCAANAFHGRTFGGMAATPQEKIQGGFRPMLDGFAFAPLNDLDAFAAKLDDSFAAVFVESIQGEGGIHPADTSFLKGLRELCDARGVLLMLDEVQCGIGRTGRFFAYEAAGIQPDAVGMAKGLGGGFPIGAVWVSSRHAELFKPGSHGTTYGGNPLACTAALATLEVIEQEGLVERVTELSGPWHEQLEALRAKHAALIAGVRGRGYMVGLALNTEAGPLVKRLREAGLIAIPAAGTVIRLLPPLTAGKEDLDRATAILDGVFSAWHAV